MTDRTPCADILRQISAYIDQELDAPTCRAIEDHCAGCAECARLVAGLRETVGLCRATGRGPLPPALQAQARARIAELLARDHGNST